MGRALNDKDYFSDTFIPLAIITTLVITVIKFSLALSLGLVGALSIVRFRAAIKEPEELVYLFFIIGIGLANGANQYFIAIIATIITTSILYIRKTTLDKKKKVNITDSSTNIIQLQFTKNFTESAETINEIKKIVKYLKLKSMSSEEGNIQYNFWFDIEKKKVGNLLKKIEKITTKSKNVSIQLYSRSALYE